MKVDTVQLGILLVAGLTLFFGFWTYCEGHFAAKDFVMMEREERKELKAEVDAIYLRSIPPTDRVPLKHPGVAVR